MVALAVVIRVLVVMSVAAMVLVTAVVGSVVAACTVELGAAMVDVLEVTRGADMMVKAEPMVEMEVATEVKEATAGMAVAMVAMVRRAGRVEKLRCSASTRAAQLVHQLLRRHSH